MKIIDKLVQDIFDDEYFKEIYNKCFLISSYYHIKSPQIPQLTEKELNDALRFADILSNSELSISRNLAYKIITFINPIYENHPYYRTVSKAVYSKLGNFPAITYLEIENNNLALLPTIRMIEMEAKKIIQKVPDTDNFVFTDSQFDLFNRLSNTTEYSFSGPTSMGKSFMIKAFIKKIMKNSPPENLVLIVPTRALINQFTIDLKNELSDLTELYNYRIITNSNVTDLISDRPYNYIFVLTPERFISYLSQDENPSIGFVFVDEAHKLANEKDSRSVTTYTAIEKALNKYGNIKLYFASPNVSNPEVFLKLFNRESKGSYYTTNESPVSQNLFFVDFINKEVEVISDEILVKLNSNNLFENNQSVTQLINFLGQDKNNLVYCNSKNKTIEKAYSFILGKEESEISADVKMAIKQVKEYIHPDYYLADLLKYKTAYHYGKLPQLIRNLIEELYKKEDIKNVFCTSTLLEGVNMPTQNIFILDNRNGLRKLSPIDFWNLSGRAGRLSRELSGNIYCLNYDECQWENKDILKKEEINLKPTVISKIDRNLQRIEKLLKDETISANSEEERNILKYIANIISVDTLDIDSNYQSPLINKLIEKNKEAIVELAKNKVKDYIIPKNILSSNQSINLKVQNDVYNWALTNKNENIDIKLPRGNNINYETCLSVLQKFYKIYKWESAEKKLNNENSLRYYAFLMSQWINNIGLSQMIKQSLDYYKDTNSKVNIGGNDYVVFEPDNKRHINIVIEKLIEDIDYILRFLLEKYFNHYFQILAAIYGEEDAGENWASLLEYGTQNRIAIALQNLGLSRNTALKIYDKARAALVIEDNKLKNIDKSKVLSHFKKDSLEYQEIIKVL